MVRLSPHMDHAAFVSALGVASLVAGITPFLHEILSLQTAFNAVRNVAYIDSGASLLMDSHEEEFDNWRTPLSLGLLLLPLICHAKAKAIGASSSQIIQPRLCILCIFLACLFQRWVM